MLYLTVVITTFQQFWSGVGISFDVWHGNGSKFVMVRSTGGLISISHLFYGFIDGSVHLFAVIRVVSDSACILSQRKIEVNHCSSDVLWVLS